MKSPTVTADGAGGAEDGTADRSPATVAVGGFGETEGADAP